MLHKKGISFLEKPASKDELLVADVMGKYFKALKEHNLVLLLSLFREEARIDSRAAGGIVSIKQYADAIRNVLPFIGRVYLRDLIIRIENSETAIVHGFSRYDGGGRAGSWQRRIWKLNKVNNSWGIIESNYDH